MLFRKKRIEFAHITTRGGDTGESGLYSGERLRKDDLVFETVGDLDELNSVLGLLKHAVPADVVSFADGVQSTILRLSSLVATSTTSDLYKSLKQITEDDVVSLEKYQQRLLKETVIDPVFVNPGKTEGSARADICRTVTRRCERRIVSVIRDRARTDLCECQRYLNRLSDVLFVVARYLEQQIEMAPFE